ncbi:hypothetical protein SAMN02745163_02087 [Clostridium cavendishii DSM 21758]|uniref:Uncharacterized protein n=1 Tax=Clostridium cavendishii DSM 21758 TaxID=1121302 RepID=A0A1M6K3L3_9CLOT|nr:hypothetical protein [Clostridium cavendishii]SHJ53500.1 hypothetical protein SAMN02745163_02087 [Clostridium cavendishii DSM 21758]
MECKCCGRKPSEIEEYIEMVECGEYKTAELAAKDDGTYNPSTEKFLCTSCYIKVGMPLGRA